MTAILASNAFNRGKAFSSTAIRDLPLVGDGIVEIDDFHGGGTLSSLLIAIGVWKPSLPSHKCIVEHRIRNKLPHDRRFERRV